MKIHAKYKIINYTQTAVQYFYKRLVQNYPVKKIQWCICIHKAQQNKIWADVMKQTYITVVSVNVFE
jgi:hypothetical protein